MDILKLKLKITPRERRWSCCMEVPLLNHNFTQFIKYFAL